MSAASHIVIACSYLHVPGGYEKAMITAANLFVKKGHRVTLLILDQPATTYYPLDPAVQVLQVPLQFGITPKGNAVLRKWWMWRDIRQFRGILRRIRPDHLLCSEYPFAVAAVLAGAPAFCRVYSWEHHHYGAQQLNRFWRSLVRRCYPRLHAVVCLNKDEQAYYQALNKAATVIPNFIEPPREQERQPQKFDLISVTRFNSIKGIDLLMQVAKRLLPPHPQLKWKVIGYGEQQEVFLDFIRQEGLAEQLIFQPADKTDLAADYETAGIFVMTSRNECFPLVLLEAMCHGLPCIAFDCETGPRHIIVPGQTGWLVPKESVQRMEETIRKLVFSDDPALLQQLRRNALVEVQQYFPDRVYEQWAALFNR